MRMQNICKHKEAHQFDLQTFNYPLNFFRQIFSGYESAFLQLMNFIRIRRFFFPINNSYGNFISPHPCNLHGFIEIIRDISFFKKIPNPFSVPVECIEMVERDAWLKDINDTESFVLYSFLNDPAQMPGFP